jgi:hypothetical protein
MGYLFMMAGPCMCSLHMPCTHKQDTQLHSLWETPHVVHGLKQDLAAHVVSACRWADMSYNRENSWSSAGPDGTSGYCANLQGFGALAFQGSEGNFNGKKTLTFAVQKDSSGNVPDATVQLSSKKVRFRTALPALEFPVMSGWVAAH